MIFLVLSYRKFFSSDTQEEKNMYPLSFWEGESFSIYGELKQVAITLLQIPTGSASVERHFSLHNRIVPEFRSNLSESALEMISFIKANKQQVDNFYQVGKFISTKNN